MDSKEEILERHMGFSYYHSHAYIRGDVFNAMDEYTLSLRKELEEAKAKIAELEKEVQIKQTAIDALLDHEF